MIWGTTTRIQANRGGLRKKRNFKITKLSHNWIRRGRLVGCLEIERFMIFNGKNLDICSRSGDLGHISKVRLLVVRHSSSTWPFQLSWRVVKNQRHMLICEGGRFSFAKCMGHCIQLAFGRLCKFVLGDLDPMFTSKMTGKRKVFGDEQWANLEKDVCRKNIRVPLPSKLNLLVEFLMTWYQNLVIKCTLRQILHVWSYLL